jgi:hypothetical protein
MNSTNLTGPPGRSRSPSSYPPVIASTCASSDAPTLTLATRAGPPRHSRQAVFFGSAARSTPR